MRVSAVVFLVSVMTCRAELALCRRGLWYRRTACSCFCQCRQRCCLSAVYTVKFAGAVYVLHAFQKKSTRGIATPQPDIEVIRARLQRAQDHYRVWREQQKGRRP